MNPLFRFLDWMIREHRDVLYVLLVYAAVPFCAWLLGRRSGRRKVKANHTFILVVRSPGEKMQVPPVIQWNFESPTDDESGPFGEL